MPRGRTDEERAYYALSERVYRLLAPVYDLVARPLRSLRPLVVRLVAPSATAKVLDLATGTGAQAMALAEAGGDVVGVDLSEPMLRVAMRKHQRDNLRFRRADAAALPFADDTFDVACVSFALHEMPQSVRERVAREMARVVRPGGSVVVVDYALPRSAVALGHLPPGQAI